MQRCINNRAADIAVLKKVINGRLSGTIGTQKIGDEGDREGLKMTKDELLFVQQARNQLRDLYNAGELVMCGGAPLSVELSVHDASGYDIADAVRIEPLR